MIIEVKNISKKYKDHFALCDVSLAVEKNDVYGIIGMSGAGKSTLIRCLARLITPDAGQILFHDKDIAHLEGAPLRDFRKKIGMIFQHFNLLTSCTVADNIGYPLEISNIPALEKEKRIDELLALVGLTAKKHAYPSQLSGGEKQRVGIARALANQPDVILCDEATSALDPKTTREILSLLRNINTTLGVTIILITHEMDVIKQICNKVAVLEKGQIVEEGSVSQVFSDPRHSITKNFVQNVTHDIPAEFFEASSPNRKLLRLKFTGATTKEPIISSLVRKFNVDANILLGWIDRLQNNTIGTLIIELKGPPEGIEQALPYLEENSVHYEVIENEP